MKLHVQRPSRRWLGVALLAAAPIAAACTVSNTPDGWAPPIEAEVETPDGSTVSVILARTSDNRVAALDLTSPTPVIWEFPGRDVRRRVSDDKVFPGIATDGFLTKIDVKGFYGAPLPIGREDEEFVLADHDSGVVYALRRDGTSARVILDTEDRVIAGVVVDPDGRTIYVATTDDRVYALDTDNPPEDREDVARMRWRVTDIGGKVWGTPALANTTAHGQVLLVPNTSGEIRALSTDDGSLAWRFPTAAGVASDIVVRGGLAYVGAFDRQFYALDVENGEVRWTQSGANWFWTKPFIEDGRLYVGDLDGKVWAWNALNGSPLWEAPYDTGERIRARPALTVAGDLVIVTREGNVLALDAATGLKIWPDGEAKLQTDNRVLADPLILSDGSILLSDDQGELWRVRVNRAAVCRVFPQDSPACERLLDADAS